MPHQNFRGYRLLVVDDSKLNIVPNPNDEKTYIKCTENARGDNLLDLNSLYDLCNKLYLDARIHTIRKKNEKRR